MKSLLVVTLLVTCVEGTRVVYVGPSSGVDPGMGPNAPRLFPIEHISLLGKNSQEIRVVSAEEQEVCSDLNCGICENYDECVECRSANSSVTMAGDLLFGVCGGRTFTREGFVTEGIEKCETDAGEFSSEVPTLPPGVDKFPTQWRECFQGDPTRRYLRIGVVLTSDLLTNHFGGDLRKAKIWLSAILAQTNLIFRYQMNVQIELNDLYLPTTGSIRPTCAETWNQPCTGGGCVATRLGQLRTWLDCRKMDPEENGVWHIFDDIPNSPGAGIAYIGALCNSRGFNAGVTAYSGFSVWRTFAHELGHNFNAAHPLDENNRVRRINVGLMGYGDGKLSGEYQFDYG